MKPHRILHVLGTAQPEGAGIARMVAAIARGLDPARFQVHAWFLGTDGPLAAELANQGIAVSVVPWTNGLRDPVGIWRFSEQLRKQPFSVVHQHYGGRALRWIVRRRRGVRIVVHLHGRVVERRGTGLVEYDVQGADCIVATSHAVAKQVRRKPVLVVYPGVPFAPLRKQESCRPIRDSRIVGTAGRLVPLKGVIHLIRAISLLRSEFPEIRLEIAGSGPDESVLREESRKLGLANCITFLGWQSDLTSFFHWDVFALPSIEEGFGIALVEAMAAGLPVVATNVGGIPEIIEHGKTGFLVPPADSNALAAQLAKLLSDSGERQRIGQAACTCARKRFSQESMVSAVEAIYKQLLDDWPSKTEKILQ